MEETPKDFDKLSVRELKEELDKAEARMKDLNEAAELAFRVIREKENALHNDCLLYTSDAADDSLTCRSRWSPYH